MSQFNVLRELVKGKITLVYDIHIYYHWGDNCCCNCYCRAAAAEEDTADIECGYCLRKNVDLEEPRRLPCGHVHCTGCITAYYNINHIVKCPIQDCRYVFK